MLRALAPIVVIATLALLLACGINRAGGQGVSGVRRLQHAARPLEQQLQYALRKAFGR